MTRVLLTGGSGYIASHILDTLLRRGHSVVTTVRSLEKADLIRKAFPNAAQDSLEFAIVKDIAQVGAFDQAIVSSPPFEAVIHTASPVNLHTSDVKKDLLDPAINGTTGILHSIKEKAPTVTRVVITSSFAAMLDKSKGHWPGHTYSEKDWNPVTLRQAGDDPNSGYEASKTFAEKAAWEFAQQEKSNFTITTMCPPMVFGPVLRNLASLDNLDICNQIVHDFLAGKAKHQLPPNFLYWWVDVRDLALCHVLGIERNEAANKRFLVAAGSYSNKELASILRTNLEQNQLLLPTEAAPEDDYPEGGVYKMDNSKAEEIFQIEWKSLENCIKDSVKSLREQGHR